MAKSREQKADDLAWRTYRKWGVGGTKKRALKEFQRMIRLEAADLETGLVTCVTCGIQSNWRNTEQKIDTGHFVPKGRGNVVAFCEDNVHPQCVRENRFLGGALVEYRKYMVARYGEARVMEIEMLGNQNVKLTAQELNDMRLEYKRRSKIAEKRLIELGV